MKTTLFLIFFTWFGATAIAQEVNIDFMNDNEDFFKMLEELLPQEKCNINNYKEYMSTREWVKRASGTGCDLSNANLDGTDFTGMDLAHVNFSGSSMRGANFTNTSLGSADLSYTDLQDAKFINTALMFADMTCAIFENTTITGANMYSAKLTNAVLSNTRIVKTNLTAVDLTNTICDESTQFVMTNFHDAYFSKAQCEQVFMAFDTVPVYSFDRGIIGGVYYKVLVPEETQ